MNVISIKRGAILRIVGLITAHSSPDTYLISLTTKIVYGYKSNYTESNKTISETGLVSIVVFPLLQPRRKWSIYKRWRRCSIEGF
jgi:hypothetical protein